jgi:hypothetical protein
VSNFSRDWVTLSSTCTCRAKSTSSWPASWPSGSARDARRPDIGRVPAPLKMGASPTSGNRAGLRFKFVAAGQADSSSARR